jgi:hypothetical protein
MIDLRSQSLLDRFAVPHQFQPRMTLLGAFVSVVGALVQIFAGSLIAAVWGVWIWLAAVAPHSILWKTSSIAALALGMASSLGLLIWSVQTSIERLTRKTHLHPVGPGL